MERRKTVERMIADKLYEVREILLANGYSTNYLAMFISHERINFNNSYWQGGLDEDRPINYDALIPEEKKAVVQKRVVCICKECQEMFREEYGDSLGFIEPVIVKTVSKQNCDYWVIKGGPNKGKFRYEVKK